MVRGEVPACGDRRGEGVEAFADRTIASPTACMWMWKSLRASSAHTSANSTGSMNESPSECASAGMLRYGSSMAAGSSRRFDLHHHGVDVQARPRAEIATVRGMVPAPADTFQPSPQLLDMRDEVPPRTSRGVRGCRVSMSAERGNAQTGGANYCAGSRFQAYGCGSGKHRPCTAYLVCFLV